MESINTVDIKRGKCLTNDYWSLIYRGHFKNEEVRVEDFKKMPENLWSRVKFDHPNIIKCRGFIRNESGNKSALVFELFSDLTLEDIIFKSPEDYTFRQAIDWSIQLAKGLTYLHSLGYIHRDIQPANILYCKTSGSIKICNFSSSRPIVEEVTMGLGKQLFVAPELLEGLSEKSDTFNFGMLLWTILSRRKPYDKYLTPLHKLISIMDNKSADGKRPELFEYWPDEIQALITSCWNDEPNNRPKMSEVLEKLEQINKMNSAESRNYYETAIKSNCVYDEMTAKEEEARVREAEHQRYHFNCDELRSVEPIRLNNLTRGRWRDRVVIVDYARERTSVEFLRELHAQISVRHVNILQFLGYSLKPTCLVFEFGECGTLSNYLHGTQLPYDQELALSWCWQIAGAIEYLHCLEPKIIHRNITTESILLKDNFRTAKLIKMNLARNISTAMTKSPGSTPYAAPEYMNLTTYSEKCDVYSFAIVMWEILERRKPYEQIGNDYQIMTFVINRNGRPTISSDTPEILRPIISSCWSDNPEERPDMSRIRRVLQSLTYKTETVEKSQKIKQRERIYKLINNPKGLCVIINNVEFTGIRPFESRTGSDVDVGRLNATFGGLMFKVEYFRNLRADEIDKRLKAVAGDDLNGKFSALVVVVLSHGNKEFVFGSDGKGIKVESMRMIFNNRDCPAFRGKPKIFILQACRGSDRIVGVPHDAVYVGNSSEFNCGNVNDRTRVAMPVLYDMLFCYSTTSGYVSFRDRKEGTWYIEALCQAIDDSEPDEEIQSILMRVGLLVETKEILGYRTVAETFLKSCSNVRNTLEIIDQQNMCQHFGKSETEVKDWISKLNIDNYKEKRDAFVQWCYELVDLSSAFDEKDDDFAEKVKQLRNFVRSENRKSVCEYATCSMSILQTLDDINEIFSNLRNNETSDYGEESSMDILSNNFSQNYKEKKRTITQAINIITRHINENTIIVDREYFVHVITENIRKMAIEDVKQTTSYENIGFNNHLYFKA